MRACRGNVAPLPTTTPQDSPTPAEGAPSEHGRHARPNRKPAECGEFGAVAPPHATRRAIKLIDGSIETVPPTVGAHPRSHFGHSRASLSSLGALPSQACPVRTRSRLSRERCGRRTRWTAARPDGGRLCVRLPPGPAGGVYARATRRRGATGGLREFCDAATPSSMDGQWSGPRSLAHVPLPKPTALLGGAALGSHAVAGGATPHLRFSFRGHSERPRMGSARARKGREPSVRRGPIDSRLTSASVAKREVRAAPMAVPDGTARAGRETNPPDVPNFCLKVETVGIEPTSAIA